MKKKLKIAVTNQHIIEKHHLELEKSVVISITSKNGKPANIYTTDNLSEILFLNFDDISRTDLNLSEEHFTLFNRDFARKILDFVEKHTDKLIICQCEAGISRSAGVAAALSKIYNEDDSFFYKNYRPNSLVYSEILKEYHNV